MPLHSQTLTLKQDRGGGVSKRNELGHSTGARRPAKEENEIRNVNEGRHKVKGASP